MASFVKRKVAGQSVAGRQAAGLSVEDRDRWPALVEALTLDSWEDGAARVTSSVSLFCDEGVLKACLSDRDGEQVAFLACEGLGALLDALESGLRSGQLDWRPSKFRGQGKVRKR